MAENSDEIITIYRKTANWYDFLDKPWEEGLYQHWRPKLMDSLNGHVLELGVGTGNNLKHYPKEVEHVTALDISQEMIDIAKQKEASRPVEFVLGNAAALQEAGLPGEKFDWVLATFLCCVMPDAEQPSALQEMRRVLKVGGKFRLVEILYSEDTWTRTKQLVFTPWVKFWYGASFDKHTEKWLRETEGLKITKREFLKDDTHILFEGERVF